MSARNTKNWPLSTLLVLGLAVATASAAPDEPTTAAIGQPAPAFTLQDADGKTHSLADLRGRYVVIEWFNPDCPYCVAVYEKGVIASTLERLAALAVETTYLAINSTAFGAGGPKSTDQVASESKAHLAANEIDIPVLMDASGAVGRSYGARTTPHMFVIDPKGVLLYSGAITDDKRCEREDAINFVVNAVSQHAAAEEVAPSQVKPWGCSVKYRKPGTATASATVTIRVAPSPAEVGKTAPGFSLTDSDGKAHKLSDYLGKNVLLEWLNPGCPYSRQLHEKGIATNTLTALREMDPDLVYLTINSTARGRGGPMNAEEVGAESDGLLMKCQEDLPVLIDNDGKVGKLYAAKTTPHAYLIDRQGVLRYEGAYSSDQSLEQTGAADYVTSALRQLIAGDEVSPGQTKPWGCSVKYAK